MSRSDLDNTANAKDQRRKGNRPPATESFGKWPDEEAREEGFGAGHTSQRGRIINEARRRIPPACRRLLEFELMSALVSSPYRKDSMNESRVRMPPMMPVSYAKRNDPTQQTETRKTARRRPSCLPMAVVMSTNLRYGKDRGTSQRGRARCFNMLAVRGTNATATAQDQQHH